MSVYGIEYRNDVVQVQHEKPDSFGSGRLIGPNLVLTARHVVRPNDLNVDSGWKIRRYGDKQPQSPWAWLDATIVYVSETHDLAVLRISAPAELKPFYRTRIASVATQAEHPVHGAGFPCAFEADGRTNLLAPAGTLQDNGEATLVFNVVPAAQPDNPHSDWQGYSGSVIAHSSVHNPNDLWIYGVAQQVPAKFSRMIEVARFAQALSDPELRELLVRAGIDKLTPQDPSLLPSASDFPDISRLRKFAETQLNTASREPMGTRATFCPSHARLLKLHRESSGSEQAATPAEILKKFHPKEAILVKAPGGFGKSFYLLRTMLEAIDEGMVPFFLHLRNIELTLNTAPDEDTCVELFKKSSREAVKWEVLRKARDKGLGIFVAVDGLNEAQTPEIVEKTLAYLLREFSDRLMLMVTDRMSERQPQFAAQLFTLLPLSSEDVSSRLSSMNWDTLDINFKHLLSIPFFLARYEEIVRSANATGGQPRFRTKSDILFAYFASCLGENHEPDMQNTGRSIAAKLAPIAFEGYRRGGIGMDENWLSDELQRAEIAQEKLRSAGLLVSHQQDSVEFSHQLFHDFLVGYQLAIGKEIQPDSPATPCWGSGSFDIATLKAKSFDALDFAVEIFPERADAFVTEVYDWNYQAAIHLILNLATEDKTAAADNARALRDALIAINSEKRFDPFEHTREAATKRAASIAQVHQSIFNDGTLGSLDELRERVQTDYLYSGDYQIWKRMFLLKERPSPRDWALLQTSPLIAWTAANAFRRHLEPGDPLIDYLCGLFDALHDRHPHADPAIGTRWRIVHIFGAANDDNVIEKLFEAVKLEGQDRRTQWVQYGAVRSLVEIAARKTEAKPVDAIIGKLVAMMGPTISAGSRTFDELRDVAIPVSMSPYWATSYSLILEKGIELASSPEERDRWTERLATLRQTSPLLS